jgi:uncharacterized protein (DUF1800 family)
MNRRYHPSSFRLRSGLFPTGENLASPFFLLGTLFLCLAISGCGTRSTLVSSTVAAPQSKPSGSLYGGQQPISGALVQLYAVSSSGDGASATPLLTQVVTSNANGNFNLGSYTCPAPSTPVYLTGTGGNAGTGNNPAIALMAALGPCGGLTTSTFISANEVTTVGSLAALFPFATSFAAIGSQTSDASLLTAAMARVATYTNTATGSTPGPGLSSGYYASSMEINRLANVIAACINSSGGTANDGTSCGKLFGLSTPSGGPAPTDTIGAILNILKNPTSNVAAIFSVAQPSPPFQPAITAAPAAWVLPVVSMSNPTITLGVTGASAVNLGVPAQYSVSVSGTSDQTVAWQVNGVEGGNSTYGIISPGGLYTPPSAVPAANALTITASSLASTTAAGSQPVTVFNPVPAVTSATGSALNYGQNFLVDVQGSGFVTGAAVVVNGSPLPTIAVTTTDLQTTVTNGTGAAMQISVAVSNPSPGATQSTSSPVTLSLPSASATAAARFLDQTSFGPTAATIAHVQQIGLLASLTEQFNTPATLFTLPPDPDTECTSNYRCTQSDWLKIATTGSDQLRQRLSLILSEIWVAPNQNDGAMVYPLNTMANDSFTNYRTIMQDLTLMPTMGAYLNMVNSGVAPVGQIPNENFGREVMQLFTLGLNLLNSDGTNQLDVNSNPIPSYTETQVQAFARAFTGWTYANADGSTPSAFNGTANWNHAMVAVQSRHDKSAKLLFGTTTLPASQTVEQDLQGALDNIFAQPNIGPFICRQLIQHLVSGNPTPAYVQRVASVFANNGSGVRGDMKAVLTAIFLDSDARAGDTQTGDQAESSPAVDGGHLREPLLFIPNLLRGLGAIPTSSTLVYPYMNLSATGLSNLNEQPFNQSSVFNYFPPSYVIPSRTVNAPEFSLENTGTIIPRLTISDALIHSGGGYGMTVDISATGVLGSKASVPATLVDYLGMIFMHSQMPTDMRNAIIGEVANIPVTNLPERAAVASYLVLTSSQYKVLH